MASTPPTTEQSEAPIVLDSKNWVETLKTWNGDLQHMTRMLAAVEAAYLVKDYVSVHEVCFFTLFKVPIEPNIPAFQRGQFASYMALANCRSRKAAGIDSEAWMHVAEDHFEEAKQLCQRAGVSTFEIEECQICLLADLRDHLALEKARKAKGDEHRPKRRRLLVPSGT
ncbi:uncharacterized protein LTR77_008546 [Saxophila tyrrhenica]|uniref:Uncharacterized protein n=1 Tax=Saxophila tyrrhenica TaxID=1690608 RepID=A0AAV9P4Z0_9PEZI|nr:hypothetical protein LTR77_008546 [Saxophila tyrrhenica]